MQYILGQTRQTSLEKLVPTQNNPTGDNLYSIYQESCLRMTCTKIKSIFIVTRTRQGDVKLH